ncbi:MAG TPA: hypothetical protein VND96_09380 [Candidatus Micrarchaeaceae archaeon]|nr:hypothetical protein [Candidatus Micrarchaeaceae archaeon]
MNAIRALVTDRRRAQRGSVLSAVLIMVAFLAIISGALMTELSTNLLLSRTLVNRVDNEATVNSAVELAFNRLQNTPLASGCPNLSPINLNGRTAAISYLSCTPVVDATSPQLQRIAIAAPFNVDGTHSVLPAQGRNDYLVGDAAGNVFDYTFATMTRRWMLPIGGAVTAPPMEMPDLSNTPQGLIELVPVSNPNPGVSPGCGPAHYCVAAIKDDGSGDPSLQCFMAAKSVVTSLPAAGVRVPDLAYFGDGNGNLFAYDTDGGDCSLQSSVSIPGGRAVVAGPIVFGNSRSTDNLYVVVSDGSSSQLWHYTDRSNSSLASASSLALPAGRVVGMAVEPGSLPSSLALTYAGGKVALVQIQSGFGMTFLGSTSLPTSIGDAPYWCQCPGGDVIGVAGLNGGLYLLDTSLNRIATYPSGGPAIDTSPIADSAGDWFFGAADGFLYEVQRPTGQSTMVLGAEFGSAAAAISSSPLLGSCGTSWICVYMGSADSALDLVSLDARRAVVTACISTSPPACSGSNPRLWASVEIGSSSSPDTVRVVGWSYYSP